MIGLIWAQAANRVIGANGTIPWRLPEDQANFKALTLGATVVMGRLTWESLPAKVRPLPGRRNIVLTRLADFAPEGAEVASSVEEALSMSETDVWIMGGERVYTAALPFADTLVVTEIDTTVDGDAFAPPIDSAWTAAPAPWQHSRTGLTYRTSTHTRTP
jgi:dihydrofolate reductase